MQAEGPGSEGLCHAAAKRYLWSLDSTSVTVAF